MDEFAFLKHNDIVYTALSPAWSKAAEMAKEQNVPYSITITTTPNNIDVPEGRWCMEKIINQATPMRWEMYDMNKEEIHKYIYDNAAAKFVHVQYTWRELGRDDYWY